MRARPTLLAAAIAMASFGAADDTTPPDPRSLVKLELIADTTAFTPGQPLTVAARLTLKPGWHVYWINPGDSGIATSPKLTLPKGWTQGPWRFPTPTRIDLPGDVVNYGYEGEVLISTVLTPPPRESSTRLPATLGLDVIWLVCKDICLPGRASAELTIPPAATASPPTPAPDAPAIARHAADLPKASLRETRDVELAVTSAGADFTLRVTGPKLIDAFPALVSDAEIGRWTATGDRLTFTARPLVSETPAPADLDLPVLLVVEHPDGRRESLWHTVRLWSAPTTAPTTAPGR